MLDIERVVTLDDLVDRVPEALIRQAEQNRMASEELIDEPHPDRPQEPHILTKDLSKAQRIRKHLEEHPEARNRDVVDALKQHKVTAADVANVKSLLKRSETKQAKGSSATKPNTVPPESTALVPAGGGMSLAELEAGVVFVKSVGSITRAKHLLIILESIKDSIK